MCLTETYYFELSDNNIWLVVLHRQGMKEMNFLYESNDTTGHRQSISELALPGLTLFKRGQHKDLYDFGETLLLVSNDRISTGSDAETLMVAGKGLILNQQSAYWFKQLREQCPNHFISVEVSDFPEPCQVYADQLKGRSMLVKKATPLPVKCVVHGYLAGSGWQDYQRTGAMSGIELPAGMEESQRLPGPLFIPHVQGDSCGNGFADLEKEYGQSLAKKLRKAALHLYFKAWKMARFRGVLLVESTFEFGVHEGRVYLVDECITLDSSRFWSLKTYKPGGPLPFLGEDLLLESHVNRQETGLSKRVQQKIYQSYLDLYMQVSGQERTSPELAA